MAEFVESRTQEFLSVWEKLKQTRIFKKDKLEYWINVVRQCEYKIESQSRTIEDLMNYLGSLKALIEDVTTHRKKMKYPHNKQTIEREIERILFSRVGSGKMTFGQDIRFWDYLLDFYKEMNWLDKMSEAYEDATKICGPKEPMVWIHASVFEWEKDKGTGILKARTFIQSGIREHGTEVNLFVSAATLELHFAQFVRDCLDNGMSQHEIPGVENGFDVEEYTTDLPLVQCFYAAAKEKCIEKAGLGLYSKFYYAFKKFPSAAKLMRPILSDLKKEFPKSEKTWNILAKVAFEESGEDLTLTALESGIAVFEEGLGVKPSIKMYDSFLKVLERFRKKPQTEPVTQKLLKTLLNIYEEAHLASSLTDEGYLRWYRLVQELELKADPASTSELSSDQVLEWGLSSYPGYWEFRAVRIRSLMTESAKKGPWFVGDAQVVLDQFKAIEDPAGESLAIWKSGLLFFTSRISHGLSEGTVRKFILSAPTPLQFQLSSYYINYLYLRFEGELAMTFYKEMQERLGSAGNLHLVMAKQEECLYKRSRPADRVRISELHEKSVLFFGDTVESWTAYMEFEVVRNADHKKKESIYQRALRVLPPDQKAELSRQVHGPEEDLEQSDAEETSSE